MRAEALKVELRKAPRRLLHLSLRNLAYGAMLRSGWSFEPHPLHWPRPCCQTLDPSRSKLPCSWTGSDGGLGTCFQVAGCQEAIGLPGECEIFVGFQSQVVDEGQTSLEETEAFSPSEKQSRW